MATERRNLSDLGMMVAKMFIKIAMRIISRSCLNGNNYVASLTRNSEIWYIET